MKKILLFLITVFLAYLTAYYTTGKKNGYPSPLNFSWIDSLDFNFNKKTIREIPDDYPDFVQLNSDMFEGYEYFLAEDYYEAIDYFTDALDDPESEIPANLMIGQCYEALEDWYTAQSYYDAVLYADPENAEAYFRRGKLLYNQEYYDQALNDLYLAIEYKYDEPAALYYLSLVYDNQGNKEAALLSALESLEMDSSYLDGMFQAGRMYYATEKYRESADIYLKYLEFDNDEKYAALNLALAYNKLQNYDSALIMYNKTIELDPEYALAYNNRGWMYYEQENLTAALRDYNKALSINPQYELPLWNRASLLYEIGDYTSALADYENLFSIDNSNANALYYSGQCMEAMGNTAQASAYYNQFINLGTGDIALTAMAKEKLEKL